MSYTVSITRNDIPSDDKQAWDAMEKLYANDNGQSAEDFVDLINKFTERYPCICDLPDDKVDDGVWSDGQLVNNAGDKITTIGVVYSQVENVIPFVIDTSNKFGFVVFDGQTGQIFRPDTDNNGVREVKKKGFWNRLFG